MRACKFTYAATLVAIGFIGSALAQPAHAVLYGNDLSGRASGSDGATDVFQVYFNAPLPTGQLTDFDVFNQSGAGTFEALVLHPLGGGQYQVTFQQSFNVTNANLGQAVSFPVAPLAVSSGDVLAHYGTGIPYTDGSGPSFEQIFYHTPNVPSAGDVITLPSANFPHSGADGPNYGGTFVRDYAFAANVNPVPEPATLVLLAVGLASCAICAWRKRITAR